MKRKKNYEPVDCTDDAMMVREHLRQPKLILIPKRKVSKEERRQLKLAKANCKPLSRKEMGKLGKGSLVPMKLTVYFDNVKKESNFTTTITRTIFEEDIPELLESFKNEGKIIKAVFFNNKPINNV